MAHENKLSIETNLFTSTGKKPKFSVHSNTNTPEYAEHAAAVANLEKEFDEDEISACWSILDRWIAKFTAGETVPAPQSDIAKKVVPVFMTFLSALRAAGVEF